MKKYFKHLLSMIMAFMLLFSLVLPVYAGNPNVPNEPASMNALNILEIQPDAQYDLTTHSFNGRFHGRKVYLTQMSMAEFISHVDAINGQYDIVYIGNHTVNGDIYGSYTTAIKSNPQKLPQGGNNKTSISSSNGDSYEQYSGNDITDRRTKVLKELIESGQLVIMQSSIFNNNSIKLNKNFSAYINNKQYPSFKTLNSSNAATIANFIDECYDTASKRPFLDIKQGPQTYNGMNECNGQNHNLSFNVDIQSTNDTDLMTLRLYVDQNGDELFTNDEICQEKTHLSTKKGYSINYIVPASFSGVKQWKLELQEEKDNGAKSYHTGITAFRGDPVTIRVLQLKASNNNSFDLSSLPKNYLNKTGEFTINITAMTAKEFNDSYPNSVNGKPTVLNGNYDMIILGFSDLYGGSDISNAAAIEAIKDFINVSKQGALFTHDTLTYDVNNNSGWSYNLTKELRAMLGQDVFNTPVGTKPASYGFTRLALDRANNGGTYPIADEVYKLNYGVLTQYPYKLDNINVADTHHQYFQLDLEDEQVIPWFTLQGNSKFNMYDGRNDYYIYSKGNITYSGIGHNAPTGIEEQKLLVNTMIKAYYAANHAPNIGYMSLQDGMILQADDSTINFSFTVKDIDDYDKYFGGEIYYCYDSNGDGKVEDIPVVTITKESKQIVNGETTNITIGKCLPADIENFGLKLKVFDSYGAAAERTVNLQNLHLPSLVLDHTPAVLSYLTGDIGEISFDTKVPQADISAIFRNVTLEAQFVDADNEPIGSQIEIAEYEPDWTIDENKYIADLGNVAFSTTQDNPTISKKMTLEFNQPGTYYVNNSFSYVSSLDNKKYSPDANQFEIKVQSGQISVVLVDGDGCGLSNIPVSLTKDGLAASTILNSSETGIVTFTDLSTGAYTLSIDPKDLPEDYSFVTGNTIYIPELNASNAEDIAKTEYKFIISKDSLVTNPEILSEDSSSEIYSTVYGKAHGKVTLTLSRPLQEIKIELDTNISTLSLKSLKILKDNEVFYANYTIVKPGNTLLITGDLPVGSYEITFNLDLGNGVLNPGDLPLQVGGDYYITINKITAMEEEIVNPFVLTISERLKINIVKPPRIM